MIYVGVFYKEIASIFVINKTNKATFVQYMPYNMHTVLLWFAMSVYSAIWFTRIIQCSSLVLKQSYAAPVPGK